MGVEAGAAAGDASLAQTAQRVGQPVEAPVEAVIVGEAAGMDAGRLQAGDVGGVHAEVHPFAGARLAAAGDRRFQVHDPQLGIEARHPVQAVAPNALGAEWCGDGSDPLFRQGHVVARVAGDGFVQSGIAVLGHQLVDAAPEHQIAPQQQLQGCGHRRSARIAAFGLGVAVHRDGLAPRLCGIGAGEVPPWPESVLQPRTLAAVRTAVCGWGAATEPFISNRRRSAMAI